MLTEFLNFIKHISLNKHLLVAYYEGLSHENKVKSVLFSWSLKLDDRRYLSCSSEYLTLSCETLILQVKAVFLVSKRILLHVYIHIKTDFSFYCEHGEDDFKNAKHFYHSASRKSTPEKTHLAYYIQSKKLNAFSKPL